MILNGELKKTAERYELEGKFKSALNLYVALAKERSDDGSVSEAIERLELKILLQGKKNSRVQEPGRIKDISGKIRTLLDEKDNFENYFRAGRLARLAGNESDSAKYFEKVLDMIPETAFSRNIIKNEKEITAGKYSLESFPQVLKVTLTNKCNVRCVMCDYWKKSLKWDLPSSAVSEIKSVLDYIQEVSWEGGEVFLSKHFAGLFEEAASRPHLRQHLTTNGLLIDESWARNFSKSNSIVVLSIDAHKRQLYEKIRYGASFSRLLNNIDLLMKNRKGTNSSVEINCVVMRSNYRYLLNILDFAIEKGFDSIKFSPVEMVNSEENIFFPPDNSALEYIDSIKEELYLRAENSGIRLIDWLPGKKGRCGRDIPGNKEVEIDENKTEDEKLANLNMAGNNICPYPFKCIYLTEARTVRPQCYCPVDVCQMKNGELLYSWNSPAMQEYRKKILSGDVAWCSYKCLLGLPERELDM